MLSMRSLLAALLVFAAPSALAQTLTATTEDGRSVRLFEDGSWMFTSPGDAADASSSAGNRPATPGIARGSTVDYEVRYDADAWRTTSTFENPSADYSFEHVSGAAYLMIIAERLYIPTRSLVDIAYQNALQTTPDMEVQSRAVVEVDGRDVTRMVMTGTSSGIPVTFLGYYYSEEEIGSIQVAGFTGSNLFEEYEPVLEEALRGLRVGTSAESD